MAEELTIKVKQLKTQGYQNSQIIDMLQHDGHSSAEIFDALSHADIASGGPPPGPKSSAFTKDLPDSPVAPPTSPAPATTAPSFPPASTPTDSFSQAPPTMSSNKDITPEEYIEAIIDERWAEVEDDIQKIIEWKNRSEQKITAMSTQFADLKDRFDKLHAALIGKIESYDKNILEVGAEIKAMEQVFSKVLPTFTENVKQLNDVADRLKK